VDWSAHDVGRKTKQEKKRNSFAEKRECPGHAGWEGGALFLPSRKNDMAAGGKTDGQRGGEVEQEGLTPGATLQRERENCWLPEEGGGKSAVWYGGQPSYPGGEVAAPSPVRGGAGYKGKQRSELRRKSTRTVEHPGVGQEVLLEILALGGKKMHQIVLDAKEERERRGKRV